MRGTRKSDSPPCSRLDGSVKSSARFPRQADSYVFDELYRSGRIELGSSRRANLTERMRAAGAGVGAFYCPTAVGTPLAEGKETRVINGREHLLKFPIKGDYALIAAHVRTRWTTSSIARARRTSDR